MKITIEIEILGEGAILVYPNPAPIPVNWRYSDCGVQDKQYISLVPRTSYKVTGLQKDKHYVLSVAA